MKLNIGSGGLKKFGFLGVDLYAPKAEIKADCDATGFGINSIEFIFTQHMIEHLSVDKLKSALEHWENILIPGGYLLINCPNAFVYITEWLTDLNNCNYENMLKWSLRNLVGWEGHGTGMLNRILFTDKLLEYFILKYSNLKVLHTFITETRVKNKNHIEYREDGDIKMLATKVDLSSEFKFIKAEKEHWSIVFDIRNHPEIRKYLVNKTEINIDDHKKYYNAYLKNDYYIIWLLVYDNKFIGYSDIKVNKDKKNIEFGFKILPEFHGIKAGSYSINNMINRYKYLFEDYDVILTVYSDNIRAIKAYEKYGFIVESSTGDLLTMKLSK